MTPFSPLLVTCASCLLLSVSIQVDGMDESPPFPSLAPPLRFAALARNRNKKQARDSLQVPATQNLHPFPPLPALSPARGNAQKKTLLRCSLPPSSSFRLVSVKAPREGSESAGTRPLSLAPPLSPRVRQPDLVVCPVDAPRAPIAMASPSQLQNDVH